MASMVDRESLKDSEWLRRQYWDMGLSTTQIGRAVGCCSTTVQQSMVRNNIPRRPYREKVTLSCDHCGVVFIRPQAWIRGQDHTFCSQKCACTFKHEETVRFCLNCGQRFYARKRALGCCSMACVGEYKKKQRIGLKCEVCGLSFRVVESRRSVAKYCSVECQRIGSARQPNRNRKGPANPQWKGYKDVTTKIALRKWREEILSRDGSICQECNRSDLPLQAHHIKSFEEYPDLRLDLTNGITLCVPCHAKKHDYDDTLARLILAALPEEQNKNGYEETCEEMGTESKQGYRGEGNRWVVPILV